MLTSLPRFAIAITLTIVAATAAGGAAPSDDWLTGLEDRVIRDVAAGKPLLVHAYAPLCDNSIIACGNPKLGDGDRLETNLYWSTTPGMGAWFSRRGGGWQVVTRVRDDRTGDADLLAIDTYRRTAASPASWIRRGAPKTFTIELVVLGWRGKAIDRALAAYAKATADGDAHQFADDPAHRSHAVRSAHLVAWVGHNRLMDLTSYQWPAAGKQVIGTIAIACHTAAYLAREAGAMRVPLLMTSDLLFANAAPLEAAILAFARGMGYAAIRHDAAAAYAGIQKRTVRQVFGAFTNPADPRFARAGSR